VARKRLNCGILNLMFTKKALLKFLPLVLIIVLAAILRLVWLDKVPNGISGDELTYVINAKAMFLTGSDISGTWNPLSVFLFKYPAYTAPQAELSYFLLMPFVGIMPFSLFAARIPFVIFSILSVLVMYFVVKELFNREVGIIASLIMAINPWFVYIGRTGYEASLVSFFFLLALYIILKAKGNKILVSIPVLFLAFYSYIGTKLSFIPFVFVAIVFAFFVVNKKKYLKQYIIVFLSCLLLVGFFLISTSKGLRLGEIFLPTDSSLAQQVDNVRKASIQTPLNSIFENKFTMYGRILFTKLFKSTASDYLFVTGDNFFSVARNGMFYILDAFFILLGFAVCYAKKKPVFWFLLTMILIGMIPQVFHTADINNFVYHLGMMFPFLIILIAAGIWEIINMYKNKVYFYASSVIVFLLYSFLLFNFLNIYFFQFTLKGFFDFNLRLVTKYAQINKGENREVDIYSPNASNIFSKYIFYTNGYGKNTSSAIKAIYKDKKYNIDNVRFLGCDRTIDPNAINKTIIYDSLCGDLKSEYPHLAISWLSDGGEAFAIFNDTSCKAYSFKPYPMNIKISDFSIEKQTPQKFCDTFIVKP
jgi:4-amino-4-deoxy-L-arabinose transferase-like glycosyltransferase